MVIFMLAGKACRKNKGGGVDILAGELGVCLINFCQMLADMGGSLGGKHFLNPLPVCLHECLLLHEVKHE